MPLSNPAIATGGSSLHAAKLALRATILDARSRFEAAKRDAASAAIAREIGARPDFRAARSVCLTLPFGSEWNSALLVEIALAANKAVAVPRVNVAQRMLELCRVRSLDRDIEPGFQGIPEPRAHCAPVLPDAVDWVLVPLVAFDDRGRRLGYGGGFYDRFLPLLRTAVPRVSGAFALQRVEQVPAAAHDVTVDSVVTEMRTWDT